MWSTRKFRRLKSSKKQKLLEEKYEYYQALREKSDRFYEEANLDQYLSVYQQKMHRKIETDMAKGMLYELILNTCNQIIYRL